MLPLLCCVCCSVLPANSATELPDSVITEGYVYEYTFSDTGKARAIMKRLREECKSPQFELDITEGDLMFNTKEYYHALQLYKRALDANEIKNNPTRCMEQIHRIISCYDATHNEAKKMEYVRLLLRKAREAGDKAMESIALFNIGKSAYYQGDRKNGYKFMTDAVKLMEETDYKNKYDNLRYEYNILFVFYQRDGMNEEALTVLESLENVALKSTGEERTIDGLDIREQKTLAANYAVVLNRLGRRKEAAEYYEKFRKIAKTYPYDNNMIFQYLFDRGLYDEVIRMSLASEKKLKEEGDTINYHMTTFLHSLGDAYAKKGDYRRSSAYYSRLAVLRDSLKAREQSSSVLELAALYDSTEKDLRIQEQTANARVRNMLLIGSIVIILLLGALLWRMFHHNKLVRHKNAIMVKTVEELLQRKDELLHSQEENLVLKARVKELETARHSDNPAIASDVADAEELDDREMFERMEHEIIANKHYLNPDFSRDDLLKIVRMPKNKFAQFFKQQAGMSYSKYINNLRLEHAARMLENHPNYTVEAVAVDCGIPARATFYRLFYEKFGVVPLEFRKEIIRRRKIADGHSSSQSNA